MNIDTTSSNLCCRGCEKWICGAQVSERNSVGTAWIMNHVPRRALGDGHLAPPLFPLRRMSPHMAPVLYPHWSTNISSAATLWTSIPRGAMSRLAALLEWQLCFWDNHDSTRHPCSAHNLIQDAALQSYGLRLCPWPLNLDVEPPNWQPNKPSFFLTKHGYLLMELSSPYYTVTCCPDTRLRVTILCCPPTTPSLITVLPTSHNVYGIFPSTSWPLIPSFHLLGYSQLSLSSSSSTVSMTGSRCAAVVTLLPHSWLSAQKMAQQVKAHGTQAWAPEFDSGNSGKSQVWLTSVVSDSRHKVGDTDSRITETLMG